VRLGVSEHSLATRVSSSLSLALPIGFGARRAQALDQRVARG